MREPVVIYTSELIKNILTNLPEIEAFLERTTSELFQCYYEYGMGSSYWSEEGHTLQDRSPHNTRIPKTDKLKENLLLMKADVELAISKLDTADQISVNYYYKLTPQKARKKAVLLAEAAIDKMVTILNGTLDYHENNNKTS